MNYFETKYLLWYYANEPTNNLLDNLGTRLNSKLIKEQEKEHLKSK